MSLDLSQVAAQIQEMGGLLKKGTQEREQHLDTALKALHTSSPEALREKMSRSKNTWLAAGLLEGLEGAHPCPPTPHNYVVIATDGSHIALDRHAPVRCYLINIGSVLLRYGDAPEALLSSEATLKAEEEELVLADPASPYRQEPVEGVLLGLRRSVDEAQALVKLAAKLAPGLPALALMDGSLILWGLAGRPQYMVQELLERGLLSCLDQLRELAETRPFCLASYISLPGSREVVNALRLSLCPHDPVDCDRYCAGKRTGSRECDRVGGLLDRDLFQSLLEEGERSPTFFSKSSVVREHYLPRGHEIHFFYLQVGGEIARVECPCWVSQARPLLELVHALVLDQCRRGGGYPAALIEAHEKAVVGSDDRERFWRMVELTLTEERLSTLTSAKSQSKRIRWI